MQEMLKEKLWTYIVHNNPDLMLNLQQDFSVTSYLEKKVFNLQPLISQLLAENKPGYLIEELCMAELTKDMEPSRFNFIRDILEDEFQLDFLRMKQTGLLPYEIMNLISESETVFNELGFTAENEHERRLRYAIAGIIQEYLDCK